MITLGLGSGELLLMGFGITEEAIVVESRGGNRYYHAYYPIYYPTQTPITKSPPQRSKSATIFIDELKVKIMETGVVKNTHKEYNPRTNKRYAVSEKQASRIAYIIAKSDGMQVGKYRGPNKK